MAESRVQVPPQVKRGEAFEVKILIRHGMETGYRLTDDGKQIPRNVIRRFTCRLNGAPVFDAEVSSGISANPYFGFFIAAQESGELTFEWVDDVGERGTANAAIKVVP